MNKTLSFLLTMAMLFSVCVMAGVKVALRVASERENFDYDAFFRAYADL